MKKPTPLRDLIPQDSRYPYAIETSRTRWIETVAGAVAVFLVFVLVIGALINLWGVQ
jgi:hypothetical protein